MALTIRCTGCRKKISVDDAFAGGVCRCPYCKEIVFVNAGGHAAASGPRPDAPVAETPAAPQDVVTGEVLDEHAYVPMANPVRARGCLTIVFVGLILVMIAVLVWWLVTSPKGPSTAETVVQKHPAQALKQPSTAATSGPGATEPAPKITPEAPPVAAAVTERIPSVGGINLLQAGPILYCIDDGKSMTDYFDYAQMLVRRSVESLKPEQTFAIMLAGRQKFLEGPEKTEQGQFLPGGAESVKKTEAFLTDIFPFGSADVGQAINLAIARKPKVIVVFTHKPVEEGAQIGELAKQHGIAILAFGLEADAATRQSLSELANASVGGQAVPLSLAEAQSIISP